MDMGRHVGGVGGDVPGGQVESPVGQESNRNGTWGWVRADSEKLVYCKPRVGSDPEVAGSFP